MKKYVYTLLGFLWLTTNIFAQGLQFEWVGSFGSINDDYAKSIVVDRFGNMYSAGNFRGTMDFDPDTGVYNLTSNGSNDVFIFKLDCAGNLKWAKSFGDYNHDYGFSITVDSVGSSFVCGGFQGTVDFDPDTGVYNLTSNAYEDIFVLKLDSSGNFLWAKSMGGTLGDRGVSIDVDTSGNVYTTGYYYGTVDFDPDTGIFNLTSLASDDIFILKLDTWGNFIWAKSLGGTYTDESKFITIDKYGNIYTTGTYGGTADFDPDTGSYVLISNGSYDVFISKLNASGECLWAKGIGGSSTDIGYSVAFDNDQNIYTTGHFKNSVDFDPGAGTFNLSTNSYEEIFILKLDSLGNFIWAKNIGGPNHDHAYSIATDKFGNIYATGYFQNTADFNPGPGLFNISSSGGREIFISKLDSAGNFVWAKGIGASAWDEGQSLICDNIGNLYLTGYYWNTVNFSFGSSPVNLTSVNGRDIFILKLSPCVETNSNIITAACTNYLSPSGNHLYTSSGTFIDTIPNSVGCDSIITILLTIYNNTSSILYDTACSSYLSPSGNHIWTISGIYTDTLQNMNGCDSTITVNLTIGNTSSLLSETACNGYLSPSGNYYWNSTGIYYDSLVNAIGCDSIITIDLTIHNSTSSIISQTECEDYTSPSGNYTWTVSGTYFDTIMNTSGCDSLITIDLIINNSTDSIFLVTACNSFTSPSGYYTWNTSGTYFDTISNIVGCDSLITFILTILENSTSTLNEISCYPYNFNGTTLLNTGTYSDTIQNYAGCDSLITLNLTVIEVDNSVTQTVNELTANATVATYQWIDCQNANTPIPGATSQSFTPTVNGSYACIITENGCTDTSSCYTISTIGMEGVEAFSGIKIYPNPANDKLVIDLGNKSECDFQSRPDWQPRIELINSNGQIILEKEIGNLQKLEFDIRHLPAGKYFVKVLADGKQVFVEKVVKE